MEYFTNLVNWVDKNSPDVNITQGLVYRLTTARLKCGCRYRILRNFEHIGIVNNRLEITGGFCDEHKELFKESNHEPEEQP